MEEFFICVRMIPLAYATAHGEVEMGTRAPPRQNSMQGRCSEAGLQHASELQSSCFPDTSLWQRCVTPNISEKYHLIKSYLSVGPLQAIGHVLRPRTNLPTCSSNYSHWQTDQSFETGGIFLFCQQKDAFTRGYFSCFYLGYIHHNYLCVHPCICLCLESTVFI